MPGVLPTPLLTTGGGGVALDVDASTPALAAASNDPWVTASFTPPVNSLIVLVAMGDWFGGTPTLTPTSSGLTFTSQIKAGALNRGVVQIWTSEVGAAGGSARTISCTTSLGSDVGGIKAFVLTGYDTGTIVDTTNSGQGSTDPLNPTALTTGADGCWVLGGVVDWNASGAPLSTDVGDSFSDADLSIMAIRKATATALSGTAVTFNLDAPGSGGPLWQWAAISIRPAAGGGGITGTAAVTEASDTSSASGQLGYSGTSAATEANDTSSASGTVVNPVTGTSAVTQANQTSSASGQLGYSGTVARTQANQTSSASGQLGYTGTSARTQANQTSSASGTFTPPGAVAGTIAVTQAAQTSAASGQLGYTGTSAVSQAGQTAAASGKLGYTGAAAPAQAGQTSTATGAVTGPVVGTASPVQANQTATAVGILRYTGTVAVSQAANVAAIQGLVFVPITGTLARTQENQTASASGSALGAVVIRPNIGTTAQPSSGTTTRVFAGVTERP